MAAASPTSRRWLFGPVPDLLLGCGGAYVLFVGLLLLPATQSALLGWVGIGSILVGLVTNTPHYGATLLRVYERREDRRRYAVFAVWITLLLAVLFVLGLERVWLGSLLLTAYVTWAPWHFAGQNYGIALLFLRRGGVDVAPGLKRLLYASFVLSFALSFLTLHGDLAALDLAPIPTVTWGVFDFVSLGLPHAVTRFALPAVSVAYLAVLAVCAARLLRRGPPSALAPAAMLVALQALWFSVPAMLRVGGRYSGATLALSAVWIAIFHSIQYLWITAYFATRTGDARRLLPYLGRTLLAGSALVVVPALLFAPALLGSLNFYAGMAMLLFAVLNLHHFILDGAIWKLRDGAVARILLRSAETAAPGAPAFPAPRFGWLRPALWVVGAASVAVAFVGALELEFGYRRPLAARDFERVALANRRLAWIGREHYAIHNNLALELARQLNQDPDATPERWQRVLALYRRSLEIHPTTQAWLGLGTVHQQLGDYALAEQAFESALQLDPDNVRLLRGLGESLLASGQLTRAREILERAQRLAPADPEVRAVLQRLGRAEGSAGARLRAPEAEAPVG